jgi:hypothetical protein
VLLKSRLPKAVVAFAVTVTPDVLKEALGFVGDCAINE